MKRKRILLALMIALLLIVADIVGPNVCAGIDPCSWYGWFMGCSSQCVAGGGGSGAGN